MAPPFVPGTRPVWPTREDAIALSAGTRPFGPSMNMPLPVVPVLIPSGQIEDAIARSAGTYPFGPT